MSKENCDVLRNWASAYGAAVRQRTVRQETTMAKHGTLPEFMYQRHCVVSEPVNIFLQQPEQATKATRENSESDDAETPVEENELLDEFDESSDEEARPEESDNVNNLINLQGEIGSSATFLIGATSKFGRAIRFNNRLLL